MPKIEQKLKEARIHVASYLLVQGYTVQEIGKILHLTNSTVYLILKELKKY